MFTPIEKRLGGRSEPFCGLASTAARNEQCRAMFERPIADLLCRTTGQENAVGGHCGLLVASEPPQVPFLAVLAQLPFDRIRRRSGFSVCIDDPREGHFHSKTASDRKGMIRNTPGQLPVIDTSHQARRVAIWSKKPARH